MSYRCFACLWPNYCNHGDQSDIIILSSTDYWYTFLPLFSADSTVSGALKISLPSPCIFVHHLSLSVPSISTYKVCTGTFIGGAWVTTVMWLCWYNNRFMNSSVSLLMHSRTAALACRWKPYRLCLHCTGNHHGNRHKPNACVPEPLPYHTHHTSIYCLQTYTTVQWSSFHQLQGHHSSFSVVNMPRTPAAWRATSSSRGSDTKNVIFFKSAWFHFWVF